MLDITEDFNDLIEECQLQNKRSQEKLYRQLYPALFAMCKTFFEDKHDILTSVNNGMLRVFTNINNYNKEKGSFFNWAYTIVRNAALSLVRDKKTATHLVFTEKLIDTTSYNPFKEKEWDYVFLLLSKLPPTARVICSLFYIEGFSIKEISTSIDMKEGTIKWHLNESRNKLKLKLITTTNSFESA